MAIFIEKEHLRDAEESDYMLMENLIQRRYDEEEAAAAAAAYLTVGVGAARALRRASAVEDDRPSTSATTGRQDSDESRVSDEPMGARHMPPRPSIVIDSLPVQREPAVRRVGSRESLHMQSETMC